MLPAVGWDAACIASDVNGSPPSGSKSTRVLYRRFRVQVASPTGRDSLPGEWIAGTPVGAHTVDHHDKVIQYTEETLVLV